MQGTQTLWVRWARMNVSAFAMSAANCVCAPASLGAANAARNWAATTGLRDARAERDCACTLQHTPEPREGGAYSLPDFTQHGAVERDGGLGHGADESGCTRFAVARVGEAPTGPGVRRLHSFIRAQLSAQGCTCRRDGCGCLAGMHGASVPRTEDPAMGSIAFHSGVCADRSNSYIHVRGGPASSWPGVTIAHPHGRWKEPMLGRCTRLPGESSN
jgi:hypothetical protein